MSTPPQHDAIARDFARTASGQLQSVDFTKRRRRLAAVRTAMARRDRRAGRVRAAGRLRPPRDARSCSIANIPRRDREISMLLTPGFVLASATAAETLGAARERVHTEPFSVEPQPWSGSLQASE